LILEKVEATGRPIFDFAGTENRIRRQF